MGCIVLDPALVWPIRLRELLNMRNRLSDDYTQGEKSGVEYSVDATADNIPFHSNEWTFLISSIYLIWL